MPHHDGRVQSDYQHITFMLQYFANRNARHNVLLRYSVHVKVIAHYITLCEYGLLNIHEIICTVVLVHMCHVIIISLCTKKNLYIM